MLSAKYEGEYKQAKDIYVKDKGKWKSLAVEDTELDLWNPNYRTRIIALANNNRGTTITRSIKGISTTVTGAANTSLYIQAVFAPNGKAFIFPYETISSNRKQILILDTNTDTVTKMNGLTETGNTTSYFSGAYLVPNGKILVNYTAKNNTEASRLYELDPITLTSKIIMYGPTLPTSGFMCNNGNIAMVGTYVSQTCFVSSSSTTFTSSGDGSFSDGSWQYLHGRNSKYIFKAPVYASSGSGYGRYSSSDGQFISGNQYETMLRIGNAATARTWTSIYSPVDDRAIIIPTDQVEQSMYYTGSGNYSLFSTIIPNKITTDAYSVGGLGPDGNIYCLGSGKTGTRGLIVTTDISGTANPIPTITAGLVYDNNYRFMSVISFDNSIYYIPYDAANINIAKLSFSGSYTRFDKDLILSYNCNGSYGSVKGLMY